MPDHRINFIIFETLEGIKSPERDKGIAYKFPESEQEIETIIGDLQLRTRNHLRKLNSNKKLDTPL